MSARGKSGKITLQNAPKIIPNSQRATEGKGTFFGDGNFNSQSQEGVKTNIIVKKINITQTGIRKRKIDTKIKKFDQALKNKQFEDNMKNIQALAQLHDSERNKYSKNNQQHRNSHLDYRISVIGSRASVVTGQSSNKVYRNKNRLIRKSYILDESTDGLLNIEQTKERKVGRTPKGSITSGMSNEKQNMEDELLEDPVVKKDSTFFTVFLYTIIFISIFGDDLRMMFLTKKQDKYFDYLLVVLMAIFLLDTLYRIIVYGKAYIFSTAFVMDIIATASILLDLSYITSKLNKA